MDVHYTLNGLSFVWDARKAAANPVRHDGVTFEQAATEFFDPFFRPGGRHRTSASRVFWAQHLSELRFNVRGP